MRAPADYLTIGKTSAKAALVSGKVRRKGDTILIEATARFALDDTYDFSPVQPGGWEGVNLERYAGAKPFQMRATWDKRLHATVHVKEEGSKRALKTTEITWTDLR